MVIRKKIPNPWRVNEEDHAAGRSSDCECRQLFYVPASPDSHGVGEHGDAVAEERAGFHFKDEGPPVPLQEKVEPAAAESGFRSDYARTLETGQTAFFDQPSHDGIGEMGVEKDRGFFPLHGDGVKSVLFPPRFSARYTVRPGRRSSRRRPGFGRWARTCLLPIRHRMTNRFSLLTKRPFPTTLSGRSLNVLSLMFFPVFLRSYPSQTE